MKLRRLAIVMPRFYEQLVGGSEYQAYLLADAAKQRGHEVHYIYVSTGKPCENRLNLLLHPINAFWIKSKRLGALWSLYYINISRLLSKIKPDVLYVRGGWSFAAMTVLYAKKNSCRSVWHVASSADVTPQPFYSLISRPFDLIERRAIEYAIRNSTHVVAHARFQADLLLKYYGRVAKVILKEQPVPEEPFVKNEPVTILWISNIKPLKQPEIFIRLAKCLKDLESVRFVMIGRPAGGKYQDMLMRDIRQSHNIEYLGEVPIETVNAILAKSHILVNTSLYEGLPNTFVQSWLRKVPVVSMLLDPDDIITTQKIGYFSGSFEKMVQDVRCLIENPIICHDMGQRARAYALQNHSLERNMQKLLNLIEA